MVIGHLRFAGIRNTEMVKTPLFSLRNSRINGLPTLSVTHEIFHICLLATYYGYSMYWPTRETLVGYIGY